MSRWASLRWARMGYAAATGAGLGSLFFWAGYWFTFVRGNLQGPDFYSFYSGAKLYVLRGGSAVYDLALQRQYELQVIPNSPDRFIVLPYFHPPYYTLLIAPLAYLDYRTAYYAMAAVNVILLGALIVMLVRGSERVHGRSAMVAAALIGGFFPIFVTVLQGQSDLVVLVPLAAAYTAWARGRPGWAGIFSGLALAKPQLLLLVPVLFIARRSWRALAGFGAVIAALGAVSVAGFGLGPVLGYVNAVGQWAIGGSLPTNGQIVYTDTAVYSLRNVLEAVPGGGKGLALAILVIGPAPPRSSSSSHMPPSTSRLRSTCGRQRWARSRLPPISPWSGWRCDLIPSHWGSCVGADHARRGSSCCPHIGPPRHWWKLSVTSPPARPTGSSWSTMPAPTPL